MKNFLIVFVLSLFYFNGNSQTKPNGWGELSLEDILAGGVYLKSNQFIYGLKYVEFINFLGQSELEINQLELSSQWVIPMQSKKFDITVGGGPVYLFGKENYQPSKQFNILRFYEKQRDFNEFGGVISLKGNYYITNNVGFGLGAKRVIAKDYHNGLLPQIRILFGNLRH